MPEGGQIERLPRAQRAPARRGQLCGRVAMHVGLRDVDRGCEDDSLARLTLANRQPRELVGPRVSQRALGARRVVQVRQIGRREEHQLLNACDLSQQILVFVVVKRRGRHTFAEPQVGQQWAQPSGRLGQRHHRAQRRAQVLVERVVLHVERLGCVVPQQRQVVLEAHVRLGRAHQHLRRPAQLPERAQLGTVEATRGRDAHLDNGIAAC
mmetsp:Transcript_32890/g.96834  ORF Transcript_32890/g.96834 Transcript_32890/m.96834 type:complete len:210 (-) Transcript_32890:5-634(-)